MIIVKLLLLNELLLTNLNGKPILKKLSNNLDRLTMILHSKMINLMVIRTITTKYEVVISRIGDNYLLMITPKLNSTNQLPIIILILVIVQQLKSIIGISVDPIGLMA